MLKLKTHSGFHDLFLNYTFYIEEQERKTYQILKMHERSSLI